MELLPIRIYASHMPRSYEQHCGLAAALDVTTQRWALLLIRDLGPGPRRFNELFAALPGISTDLLADRLRVLESAGAVERAAVGSNGHQYALTARGRELSTICHDLAQWGMPLLPPFSQSTHRADARWALQTMAANSTGTPSPIRVHLVIEGNELTLATDADGAQLAYGLVGNPDVIIQADTTGFFTLRARILDGTNEVPGGVEVDGPLDVLSDVFASLPLTKPAP